MVEDKWQARGKGRKEVRTHQPTGGRGAQGGLKIGEMDRDAIIGHGISSFVKESFMERSDGAKIPICVSCGTIPIYNPRLGIAICQLCDGPVKYMGDNVNNLEILPPLGRPKSQIVEVEMPYSTKLLTQETEAFLNMTMRYITTSGVTRLNPLQYSTNSTQVVKELQRLILPEPSIPAYIEEIPKAVLTVEELKSMGASVQQLSEEEKKVIDNVLDDTVTGQLLEQQVQLNETMIPESSGAMIPISTSAPINNLASNEMLGGMPPPSFTNTISIGEGVVSGAAVPGIGPIITVRTDPEAMMMDGIMEQPAGRSIRRNPYRFGGSAGNSMSGMSPMMNPMMGPIMNRYTPASMDNGGSGHISSSASVRVTKLE